MTDTRELLGMMTAHGCSMLGPAGGMPRLTAQDVAGAMGMGKLPRHQGALLLVKFCADEALRHELWSYWFRRVVDHAVATGWRNNRRKGEPAPPPRFQWLARRSLEESLTDNLCRTCEGRADIRVGGVVRLCPACLGTGRDYDSGREWARALDVDEKAYRNTWADRVQWCRGELLTWEVRGVERVRVALMSA